MGQHQQCCAGRRLIGRLIKTKYSRPGASRTNATPQARRLWQEITGCCPPPEAGPTIPAGDPAKLSSLHEIVLSLLSGSRQAAVFLFHARAFVFLTHSLVKVRRVSGDLQAAKDQSRSGLRASVAASAIPIGFCRSLFGV